MAAPDRRNAFDLIRALRKEPHRFGFFQAIRLLALAERPGGDPLFLPAGLRFRTPASLAFPAAELKGLDERDQGGRMAIEVGLLGLTGPSGALPHPYTELLLERRHLHRDGALHAFLDVFSHRACCLFFAAWRKYRFHVAFELGQGDRFTGRLFDLLAARPGQPEESLIHYAGALARRPLPTCSLVAFLRARFEVPVRLEPFAGQWTAVPVPGQTRLGGPAALGEGAFLGVRLWDPQNKIRLCLGPLSGPQFRAFLPGGARKEALGRSVALHLGPFLACDLELDLQAEAVPDLVLDGPPGAPRLGLDTWLHTRPAPRATVAFRLQT